MLGQQVKVAQMLGRQVKVAKMPDKVVLVDRDNGQFRQVDKTQDQVHKAEVDQTHVEMVEGKLRCDVGTLGAPDVMKMKAEDQDQTSNKADHPVDQRERAASGQSCQLVLQPWLRPAKRAKIYSRWPDRNQTSSSLSK